VIINYPKTLIIGTSDIVAIYRAETIGLINSNDMSEIMTQVLQKIINWDFIEDEYYKDQFPNYRNLIWNDFLVDPISTAIVDTATKKLLVSVYNRLSSLNAIINKDFPYFFYKFIGDDIVLNHLPF